jgi:hypothetical protein
MQQLTPAQIAALLGRVIQSGAQFYLSTCSGAQPGQAIVVEGHSALAAQAIPPGPVVLVQSGNQWLAYPPRQEAGSQRVVQNTRRRQQSPNIQPFLETFLIRIESPAAGDIHILDAHQFWDVRVVGVNAPESLTLTATKAGETSLPVPPGTTIKRGWAIVATVGEIEPDSTINANLLLRHGSNHRSGWESWPFHTNRETGAYILDPSLPYAVNVLALEGVPSGFNWTVQYTPPGEAPQVVDLDADPPARVPAGARLEVLFERTSGEELFRGTLLVKRIPSRQDARERLIFDFVPADGDGAYILDPYQHYAVRIEGVESVTGATITTTPAIGQVAAVGDAIVINLADVPDPAVAVVGSILLRKV